ncbi:hypothetical protein [Streptomyces sp. 4F14]|uniref:hypothetical protein n=1 Tax=Streptomyces sp. 4F14 TaxID=3394380 RepID=UPI003A838FBE
MTPQVPPHVHFFGRCEEAVEFCRTALGTEAEVPRRYSGLPAFHDVPAART